MWADRLGAGAAAATADGTAPHWAGRASAEAAREGWIFFVFAAGVISVVFLQKLCLPGNIEVAFPIEVVSLMLLFAAIGLRLNVSRLVLYAVFCVLAVTSQFLRGRAFSFPSLLMAVSLYAPFCVEYKVSAETYKRCLRFFLDVMIVITVIVWVEHVIQLAIGYKYWINLDNIIPDIFQYKHYAYIHSMEWKSKYLKPNGIFFAEVSILSQFLGLAFLIELRMFQRPWRLAVYLATVLATFAGTGLLLIAVSLPFLMPRLSARVWAAMAVIGGMMLALAIQAGWYETMAKRVLEFGQSGRSANERFVAPLDLLADFARRPSAAFVGNGAGTMPINHGEVWWPITKVSVEYGIATGIALYVFLIVAMFRRAPDKVISLAFIIFYSFLNGSFILPYVLVSCALFCTFLRVDSQSSAPPAEPLNVRAGAALMARRAAGALRKPTRVWVTNG